MDVSRKASRHLGRCPHWRPLRWQSTASPTWRGSSVLDDVVQKEARPISLRQLTFFGRTLTERRLLESAEYLRTELPVRLAHRLRDMQTLPYVVVSNPNISHVYHLYEKAFDILRRVPPIESMGDNEDYCKLISTTLREHLTVIPRLAMGILQSEGLMNPENIDSFMNTMLKSRISRRVIAEQHLALTETFNSPWHFPGIQNEPDANAGFVGKVFLRCNAREVVQECFDRTISLVRDTYGDAVALPEIDIKGNLQATFPYILSHLQYIVGELLRNSIQAIAESHGDTTRRPPPVQVLICDAPQHVIIRVSDQGGGISHEILPRTWSFSKGPRTQTHLKNLSKVPKMAATMEELKFPLSEEIPQGKLRDSSLSSLSARPPDLLLGIGLPMSRAYAEYWAGSLELHNLDGYGVDAFLQIPKLGHKNEQVHLRAVIDAV